jgi:hypothetical protein
MIVVEVVVVGDRRKRKEKQRKSRGVVGRLILL